jgi:hypothetical protein
LTLSPLIKLENYKITKFKRLKYLKKPITKVKIVFHYFLKKEKVYKALEPSLENFNFKGD